MENLLLFIPLLPLLGALINGTLGRRLPAAAVSAIAVSAVAIPAVISTVVLLALIRWIPEKVLVFNPGAWFEAGGGTYVISASLIADPLSAFMMITVTVVSTLIHVYSVGYMKGDPGYARYFSYLNLFVSAMLILVMAGDMVLMFVGWEGVGLCSYLLIGFWFTDNEKASAGKKAFVVNRIGDVGFMLGMLILLANFGTSSFDGLRGYLAGHQASGAVITAATLLLFVGACGKSAQLPLYIWLPDAMAGPTPVSALIHAATMVTAGVYMVCRLSFMFALAPITMAAVALVGTATALFAATIGLAQNDIKKVLAYSTVSQLGFMFAAAGVAAFSAAMFHLLTHAFFKACLFLCAGSVIHGLSGEQDIRKMGGLGKKMPDTAFTFLISTLAIAGVPPFSGFFSKDEILWMTFISRNDAVPGLNYIVWGGLAITSLLTAIYMFRLYYMVFKGSYRGGAHAHESPPVMTWPLFLLTSFTLVGGLFAMPEWFRHYADAAVHAISRSFKALENNVDAFLTPSLKVSGTNLYFEHFGGAVELAFVGFSILVAVAGWLVARRLYGGGDGKSTVDLMGKTGTLGRAVAAKWYVDEIIEAAVIRPYWALSRQAFAKVDGAVIEKGLIGGSAKSVEIGGILLRAWQNGNAQRYLAAILITAAALLYAMVK